MLATFYSVLTPMLTLAVCILVGYALHRFHILPDNAGKVMAKLETWVFLPALCFYTTSTRCTPDTISTHSVNLMFALVGVTMAIGISYLLVGFFCKKGDSHRGVYLYALAFANSGYMGDPLVIALFPGTDALAYYKVFCLPISLAIYTWGISGMIPSDKKNGGILHKVVNPPTMSLLLGIVFGLLRFWERLPTPSTKFALDALEKLSGCMGPVAMLLAGFTIGGYHVGRMLRNRRVYAASLLRLTVIPTAIITVLFCFRLLLHAIGLEVGVEPFFLSFFAIATPLGLNTVVFPEAYGGDAETGAGMTLVSHTLCILTIPLLYTLMTVLFGTPFTTP